MSIRRNIRIMYAIALLQGMVFYAPIATLYRQNVGLGVFEIALIESISLAISIAMELPWGVVADRLQKIDDRLLHALVYLQAGVLAGRRL